MSVMAAKEDFHFFLSTIVTIHFWRTTYKVMAPKIPEKYGKSLEKINPPSNKTLTMTKICRITWGGMDFVIVGKRICLNRYGF